MTSLSPAFSSPRSPIRLLPMASGDRLQLLPGAAVLLLLFLFYTSTATTRVSASVNFFRGDVEPEFLQAVGQVAVQEYNFQNPSYPIGLVKTLGGRYFELIVDVDEDFYIEYVVRLVIRKATIEKSPPEFWTSTMGFVLKASHFVLARNIVPGAFFSTALTRYTKQ
ncbi:hypothetical protein AXF42_Ash006810 [Apostasia shenzhenica]|uniref:Cystatin domain-containing protein n=1 Tax=Apostasia shenzhenica TaxID=1088818 RepID=A0A2I0AJ89_9ASPA|nr:hypothetical protein AXF42_Ash006810 [Apostasia shenzhenica]